MSSSLIYFREELLQLGGAEKLQGEEKDGWTKKGKIFCFFVFYLFRDFKSETRAFSLIDLFSQKI